MPSVPHLRKRGPPLNYYEGMWGNERGRHGSRETGGASRSGEEGGSVQWLDVSRIEWGDPLRADNARSAP